MRKARKRELVLLLMGRLRRYRVSGPSMEPTLPDGCTVLVDPSVRTASAGDIVLARHPTEELQVLKRVERLTADGHLVLRGDGSPSTDSRHYGPLSPQLLQGKVVCLLT